MTTTVLELIENLKHYPGATVVTIKDVDDVEFAFASSVGAAIVDFKALDNTVTIIIGENRRSGGRRGGIKA
ncbi:hypothetical protein [Nostoc sp. 'Peltigera membranacea cyanobiont' 232]|uniref:hypothetical protein n=1 Tax=Nostoc sp. 'Peltigera membranacea cyanobiont' 232 TaxID=2014531 RepID=UPI000B95A61D|nr:hypothetical protein [Nostoc sp. 'Peltigera membranacea cyanobiont' 232]OYE02599.1 hypothetical protein CDG79_23155 [Nostoc sp. 'Peltigera membranacea cyanobiont' 232]